MVQWTDQGLILGYHNFGENKRIINVFTLRHGKYRGMLRISSKFYFFPGTAVEVSWKARLEEHLGNWTFEEIDNLHIVPLLDNPGALMALNFLCLIGRMLLPERVACPMIYYFFIELISELKNGSFLKAYVIFESKLLCELGYSYQEILSFSNQESILAMKENILLEELKKRQWTFLNHWPHLTQLLSQRKNLIHFFEKRITKNKGWV